VAASRIRSSCSRSAPPKKGLDLAYVVDEGVPDTIVRRHHRACAKCSSTLLSNAVKFTATGEILVTVKAEAIEGGRFHGALLGARQRHRHPRRTFRSLVSILQPSHASTTRHYGGTGLASRFSKRLSVLMGGAISCDSVVGQGSTFHFSIVAALGAESAQLYLRGDQPHLRDKRVLVVDDNPTNLAILARRLEGWGMKVTAPPRPRTDWRRSRKNAASTWRCSTCKCPIATGWRWATKIRAPGDRGARP